MTNLSINGATRVYFIIGDPIAQVRSPAGMSAGFQARGVNALMIPLHLATCDLADFFKAALAMQNCDGICITVPHKMSVLPFCSGLSSRSKLLGAVNIMRRQASGFYGDMLDGHGFCESLIQHTGEIKGKRALLAGAGGAGSAIALELLARGVRELHIYDEDVAKRDALLAKLGSRAKAGTHNPTGFDVVCNATPSGMQAGDKPPFNFENLTPEMQVGCVVTTPPLTPLIVAARAMGCKTATGNDMYAAMQDPMLAFYGL